MAELIFSHLLNGLQIVIADDVIESKGIGPKLGGGLRSAPSGMAFVDITGRVDADADGIVFEGIPGMERPIIPKFVVPKELAGKLSKLVEGDSIDIEKQRRAGNLDVQFDEDKFNKIVASLKRTEDIEVAPISFSTKWNGKRPLLSDIVENADLSGADLSNIDLSGRSLSFANMRSANFSNTNLSNADLRNTNLFAADLSNANLSEADLRGANIFASTVNGANFRNSLMPDMSKTFAFGMDSAVGMSSRSFSRQGMQSLSVRDRRKLEAFAEETWKEWKRASGALAMKIGADDPYQAVQDAYQDAMTKLLTKVDEQGIGALDEYFAETDLKTKIQSYIETGIDDARIAALLDTTPKQVEDVRKYGVPSPAKAWVNRVKRTAAVDVVRKEQTQKGQISTRRVAEQRLNNLVWDLIDSGKSDNEIIEAVLSNEKFDVPTFGKGQLEAIRQKGRVAMDEGTVGMSTGVSSIEVENARRGRGAEDWVDSGVDSTADLLGEDAPGDFFDVEAGASSGSELTSDEKRLRYEKLKEALKDSFDVMQFMAERRSSTNTSSDNALQKEAAEELKMSRQLVSTHVALMKAIKERAEDGRFNDPDWIIPFDEIAEFGKSEDGIKALAEKYDLTLKTADLLARQVAGVRRRIDTKSTSTQKDIEDFVDQYTSLINQGYSRGEIVNMIPGINSQTALNKRIQSLVKRGDLEESYGDTELLAAIQIVRKKGSDAVSPELLQRIKNMGINVGDLAPVFQMTEEEKTFTALQASGKTRGQIMEAMNISTEQYQRLYSRLRQRK